MVAAVDNARKQRKYIPHLEMQLPFQVAVQQAQPLSSTLSQLFVFVRDKQLKRGDDNSTRGVFLSSLYSFSIHATNLTELKCRRRCFKLPENKDETDYYTVVRHPKL